MSEPIISLDENGKATIISYNVPEPTSYSGSNLIELEFPESIFNKEAKTIPENRKNQPTKEEVESAVDRLINKGVVDNKIFPNIITNKAIR